MADRAIRRWSGVASPTQAVMLSLSLCVQERDVLKMYQFMASSKRVAYIMEGVHLRLAIVSDQMTLVRLSSVC